MTMHSDSKGPGFASNVWAQMGIVVVAAVVLIALAAHYVW